MPYKNCVVENEHSGAQPGRVGQLQGADDGWQSFGHGQPASSLMTEPGRLVLAGARSRLLADIVDSLVQGAQFIALTGVRGVGKTLMAASVREELNKRSVPVRWVDGAGGNGIRLRTITSQVLGKPEADINDGDIEQLFDTMTERESAVPRSVLIIDDAEQLLPDAIGYLRLLASVAMERMPQILFVGHSSFWDTAEQAAQAGFGDLIRTRFELEPLSSREACAATQRLMSTLSPSHRPVFDSDALEMVVQRAGGLISRLFPLVVAVAAVAAESDQPRVTTAMIDAAVDRIEGGPRSLAPAVAGNAMTATTFSTIADGRAEVLGTIGTLGPIPIAPHRDWCIARISGAAVALLGSLGVAAYWLTPIDANPVRLALRVAAQEPNVTVSAIPDTTIIIRLPPSVQPAGLDTSSYDDVIAVQETSAPAAPTVSKLATSVAVRWPGIRKRTVVTRPEPGAFTIRANRGTWLFPPNPNG